MSGRPAIFMDRDGTICQEVGYVNHVSRCALLPRSAAAIRRINESGRLALVVTNQAGVARGYFEEPLIGQVHERMRGLLAEGGARVDGIYYCAHHPTAGEPPYRAACDCRKPMPGMLLRGAREHDVDLARSWMIGDSRKDIEAGHAAGTGTVMVMTGYGRGEWERRSGPWDAEPAHTAEDLLEAVEWILTREAR